MKKNIIYMLFYSNIFLFSFFILAIFWGFKSKDLVKTIEAQQIIVRNPDSKASISLTMNKDVPEILISDEKGKAKVCLSSLGLYVKNEQEKIIASITALADGGGGLGLADKEGFAASIIRGGSTPSIALFGQKSDPIAAFGIAQNVPHLIISAEKGNEGLLLHGGERSGIMVLDEAGQMKVFICKEGIFQGKQQDSLLNENPQKEKFFTHKDDKDLLFPENAARKNIR